jgi:hypothetical protein
MSQDMYRTYSSRAMQEQLPRTWSPKRPASTIAWMQEVERLRTNIGHIRVKMLGANFPDKAELLIVLISLGHAQEVRSLPLGMTT